MKYVTCVRQTCNQVSDLKLSNANFVLRPAAGLLTGHLFASPHRRTTVRFWIINNVAQSIGRFVIGATIETIVLPSISSAFCAKELRSRNFYWNRLENVQFYIASVVPTNRLSIAIWKKMKRRVNVINVTVELRKSTKIENILLPSATIEWRTERSRLLRMEAVTRMNATVSRWYALGRIHLRLLNE